MVQLSHPYMTTGKTTALTIWTFVGQVVSLLFNILSKKKKNNNTLSRFVIASLPRNKCLLVLCLQSLFTSTCHKVMGLCAMILVFWMLTFKPTFSLSSFTFIRRLFSSSLVSSIKVVSFAYLRLLMFLLEILIPAYISSSRAFHMMYSAYVK